MRWFGYVSLVLLLAACGKDGEEQTPPRETSRPAATRDSVVRQPVYPEAEAAQILRAINENEIAVSRLARERSQNDDILRYASVMIADHQGMTQLLDSLLPPIADSINAESRALRQAGSTLKPFLYALAIERGYLTAASLLDDSPLNLDTANGLYIPQNYDRDFKGPVSVRTALGNSLNVPAVRALVLTGVDDFRERLHDLGYEAIAREGDYYGFSLALGSAEVSLWQQARAYRTLARGGINKVATVGTQFDPTHHEAIQQIETDDHPAGTVVAEVQPGYTQGDRLIRAAMVVVAKPKSPGEGGGNGTVA